MCKLTSTNWKITSTTDKSYNYFPEVMKVLLLPLHHDIFFMFMIALLITFNHYQNIHL